MHPLSESLILLTVDLNGVILSVYPPYIIKADKSIQELVAQPYQKKIKEALEQAVQTRDQISTTAVWHHAITLSGPFLCKIQPIQNKGKKPTLLNLIITPNHSPSPPLPQIEEPSDSIDHILENLTYNAKKLTRAKEATISLFINPTTPPISALNKEQLDYNQLVIKICYLITEKQKSIRLTTQDLINDPEWHPWHSICMNLLAVPIFSSDKSLIGVIQVSNKKEEFSVQDKDALEQLASLAIVTLSETGTSVSQLQTSHLLRTNALLTRLSQISSEFKNFNDLNKVKDYLADQLNSLNLHFSICLYESERNGYCIDYISIDSLAWRLIDRLLGLHLKNLFLPSTQIYRFESLYQQQPVFSPSGLDIVHYGFPNISKRLLRRVVRIANLHHDTPILNIPLTSSNQNHIGLLSVWGNIQEADIPSFVLFAKQLSATFVDVHTQQTEKDIRLREQAQILDLAQFFLHQSTEKQIFSEVIKTIESIAQPQLAGIFLQQSTAPYTFSLVNESTWPHDLVEEALLPNTLLGSVAISNQSLIIREGEKEAKWNRDPLLSGIDYHHYYLIPFASPKQTVGIVVIGWSTEDIPDRWYRLLSLISTSLSQVLQRNYLTQQTNRRLQELAGLHELTLAFTNQNNLTQTYSLLTKKLALLINANICFVATYDATQQLVVAQEPGYGLSNEMIQSFQYPIATNKDKNRFDYPQLRIINNRENIPDFFPTQNKKTALKTVLIAPMYHDGTFIGLVLAANKTLGFSEDDAHLMAVFAGQTAVVISNSHLFIETQRRVDELIVINEIAKASLNITDPNHLIDNLTRLVSHQFFTEFFGFLYVNHHPTQGEILTYHPSFHTPHFPPPTKTALADTTLSETIKTGMPTLHHQPIDTESFLAPNTQSALSTPVTVNGIIVGALHAESSIKNFFDSADQLFLVTLSRQLSFALEKIDFLSILERSEERYRILSELTSDYAYALRVNEEDELSEEWFTGALFTISGYKPEELLQKGGLSSIIHPEDVPSLKERTTILLSGKTDVRELRIVTKKGETRWLRTYGKPMWDQIENRVKYIYAAAQDITPRKEAEAETVLRTTELEALAQLSVNLRHTETAQEMFPIFINQAAQIVSATSGCIYMLDERTNELVVRYWYPHIPHLIGLRQPNNHGLTGKVFSSGELYITNDLSSDQFVSMLSDEQEALKEIRTSISLPLETQDKIVGVIHLGLPNKHTFTAEEIRILRAIAEVAGSALSRAILLETLEERVSERTSELAEANVRLQELDRMKSQLVSDVSHELRTPIANLKLYVELINRVKSAEKQQHYLSVMSQQMDRLEQLVTDILDMSRLELGKKISFAPTNLNELTDMIVTAHLPKAELNQLTLSFEPYPNLPLIMAEQNQIAQVITNLVANAINYTESGFVRVHTNYRLEDEQVELSIIDSGRGIAPLDQPHLFQRFYRGKDSSNDNIPGTGLGLAIVKEIVDLHQGEISLVSNLNEGSTFTVLLPLNLIDSPTQI